MGISLSSLFRYSIYKTRRQATSCIDSFSSNRTISQLQSRLVFSHLHTFKMRGQTVFSYALVAFAATALAHPTAVDSIEERDAYQIPGLAFAAKVGTVDKERDFLERRQA